jgi:trans-aconitate methyltransferase
MSPESKFGAEYFRKYYLDRKTRVVTAAEMRARANLILAILRQVQVPVRRILDAGCGIGLLQAPFAQLAPRARYTGLEHSDYLCAKYGWKQGSVTDHVAAKPYDLVVCYDVLQYLNDRDAAAAVANLGRLSRAAIYVSALTREDWLHNCDRSRTDRAVHLRPAGWYRRRLQRHSRYLGFGVWLRRDVSAILWELESRFR